MRVLGLFALIIVLLSFGINTEQEDYLLLDSKKFTVRGETSIGKFNCKYSLKTEDTLFLSPQTGLADRVRVKDFKCGNFILNHDFRKTLNAKEYPEVAFSLSDVQKKEGQYQYHLDVEIAGVHKKLEGLLLTKKSDYLEGEVQLSFSDFDLSPPEKLGGAIKVEEEILLQIKLDLL